MWSIRSASFTSRTSFPRTSTRPSFTSQKRVSRLAMVDLPPPEGPTRASIWCRGREKEMSCNTSFSP